MDIQLFETDESHVVREIEVGNSYLDYRENRWESQQVDIAFYLELFAILLRLIPDRCIVYLKTLFPW